MMLALIGVVSSAAADERSMKTAMAHCYFVLLSGQSMEKRFPNAVPDPRNASAFTEIRGETKVTVSPAQRICRVEDATVTEERAEEMVPDVAHIGRIVNLEKTFIGRGEPAVRGYFNKRPVVISWYRAAPSGAGYYVKVEE
jgi:hypothetical protein